MSDEERTDPIAEQAAQDPDPATPDDLGQLFASTLTGASTAASEPATAPEPATPWLAWRPGRVRAGAAAFAVLVGGLLPLYGDPRATPYTHPLWAHSLLRSLDMGEAVRVSSQASQIFSTLSWKESLTFRADQFLRSDGVQVLADGAVSAGEGVGEVTYPVAIVQAGDYRLRCRVAGDPSLPPTAEIAPIGGRVLAALTFSPPLGGGWADGGTLHLDPGAYAASVLLPAGSSLGYLEVAPPCVNPIEPPGGWRPTATTTVEDVAVTVLRALDLEHELPPAELPIVGTGEAFQVQEPVDLALASIENRGAVDRQWLRAPERRGLRAVVHVEVPVAGRYSLSAFTAPGLGQAWLADDCRKSILCEESGEGWRPVMTQHFDAGRHFFTVVLTEGAGVQRFRLERKKAEPADYVAALRQLGLELGPPGPVDRARAQEALRFVARRRGEDARLSCGDVRTPRTDIAPPVAAPPAQVAGVEVAPPGQPAPGQPPPGPTGQPSTPGFPVVDPQPPASPTLPLG